MKSTASRVLTPFLTVASLVCWAGSVALANPYASALTNNAGTVSFTLNEAADKVRVISGGGASTNDLGPLPPGTTVSNLNISGAFKVEVSKAAPGGWTQISADTNVLLKFNSPRGVAVNMNPASPYFGRVYVANSAAGTTAGRAVGDGIYLLNADLSDALGRADTASDPGINFTLSTSDPWKLGVGADDNLYINNFSTAAATTWVTDPNVSGTYVTNVLAGIGENTNPATHTDSANTPIVKGSLAAGNLTLWNIEGAAPGAFNSIARWDIGGGPLPFDSPPTILGTAGIPSVADLSTDLEIGSDGKFYTILNRSAGTDSDSLRVYDTNATTLLWGSLAVGGSPDPLRQARALMVSPDGKNLAIIHDNNNISVIALTNGIPDLAARTVISNAPNTTIGRDIAFDAAGNIYTVSSGQALLRVFSPGGTIVATTDSAGAFSIVTPLSAITVTSTDDTATEAGLDPGEFTVLRTGDTSRPLTILYEMTGTASNGVDYAALSGSVIIPAGTNAATAKVMPINDSISEFTETAVLHLLGSPNYTTAEPSAATVSIVDDDPPELSITTVAATMYERLADDRVIFRITRRGQTNAEVTANISFSGTASSPADFAGPATVTVSAGVVDQDFTVSPVDDNALEGDETLIAGLGTGSGYSVGAPNSATATILDDELAPESGNILFSDNFETDTSAGWRIRFGANNAIDDFFPDPNNISYDYSADGIPPAPGSGATTKGLKITVNKFEGSAFGAAGINFYPAGQTFSNDFALRFNMYLVESTSATTEFALFGINHSGNKTNWFRNTVGDTTNPPVDVDGLWYAIVADASGLGDYTLYTGTNATSGPTVISNRFATSFESVFKAPPFSPGDTGRAGSPANLASTTTPTWADVEISQIGNVVTLKINRTIILQTTNATPFTSGSIMLGYDDAYDSVGNSGAVIYDNVRVVNLSSAPVRPSVSAIQVAGGNVQIDFTGASSDTPAAFALLSSANVETGYATDSGATITQVAQGQFRAVVAVNGDMRFYRIQR